MEKNKAHNIVWDRQIELFAKYFLVHAKLPENKTFNLLDVGCGTGTALRIIKYRYPQAELSGCDLEPKHIEICKQLNGQYGNFFVSDIESLDAQWDIIYLSNVLEHLYNWEEQLEQLLSYSQRLYLLIPYKEKITYLPFDKHDNSFHINSFENNSFNYLKEKGYKINIREITTPYAWGSSPIRSLLEKYNIGRSKHEYKSELLVCITHKNNPLPKPFFTLMYSIFAKSLLILLPIYINKYLHK